MLELLLDLPEDVRIVSVSQRDDDILVEVEGNLNAPADLEEAPAMYHHMEDGVIAFVGYEPPEAD